MPPAYVNTIWEEILYEHAKLISRLAYGTLQRGFIIGSFKKLLDRKIIISGNSGGMGADHQIANGMHLEGIGEMKCTIFNLFNKKRKA